MIPAGHYTLLQELADREAPTYAARHEGPDGATELVVVERYASDSAATPEDRAELEALAHASSVLTELSHPNLASVREIVMSDDGDVAVVSAFVDGDSYEQLLPGGSAFAEGPFLVKLAVMADVIEGLAALHAFAREKGATIVHGGVTPRNVVLCSDGRTRLVRVCNLFPEQVSPASPTLGYIAPELLDPSRKPEPSVDVFGAGVMLWEVLVGKRLAVQTNAPRLLLKEFDKGPPRGIPQEHFGWAKGFIGIVERALAPASERYENAEQMAMDVRALFERAGAGSRASVSQMVDFVEQAAGERIRERRAELGFAAPLPMTSSRATIAPMRARPSLPEVPALPPPPRVARIALNSMVDEDEFSSRSPLPVSDQDDNQAGLMPVPFSADTLLVDAPSADVFWRGGEPTDEKDAMRSGVAENELRNIGDSVFRSVTDDEPRGVTGGEFGGISGGDFGSLTGEEAGGVPGLENGGIAGRDFEVSEKVSLEPSSFPPPMPERKAEPLFEDRSEVRAEEPKKRAPGIWLAVAVAAILALALGYGLGRGQKPGATVAGNGGPAAVQAPAPAETPQLAVVVPDPAEQAPPASAHAEPAAAQAAHAEPAADVTPPPAHDARASAHRSRSHAPRGAEPPVATPAMANPTPIPSASAPAAPEPSAPGGSEGRQKFNPQGI